MFKIGDLLEFHNDIIVLVLSNQVSNHLKQTWQNIYISNTLEYFQYIKNDFGVLINFGDQDKFMFESSLNQLPNCEALFFSSVI